ncbi:phosphotransferase family protein [Phenylobacterium sp. LjRoot225]|uniref:phosphotransferase family protein n=1 Tax=Phenylobacterium sp. LjRoot225 TaxID=3342285 RepID=UPI003ECF8AD1
MSVDTAQAGLDDFGGLIDWPHLNEWIAGQDLPGTGPVTGVRKLKGGLQNNVFLLERGADALVLRRPSKHLRPNSNDTMLREARVLRALAGSAVPHPDFYAVCEDPAVIGACFYLMEPLEGFAPMGKLQGDYETDVSWRAAMGDELVRAAAALAAVDPQAAGLSDLGKPDDWHARQVSRWRSQLEGYAATPGYDPKALPHVDEVGRWLSDNLPGDRRIGLIHGDLQFANVMFSLKAPRISGVIDWELTTLGDPMLDLGWILTSWWEEGDPPGKKPLVTPWDGFRSRAELVDLYAEAAGRSMADLPWFFALACYKLACLLEGTYAASKAGKVPAEVGESVHGYASWLMTKGRQIIAG